MSSPNMKIEDILPHRGRMLLIDTIAEVHEDKAVTEAVVTKTWPLVRGGSVDPIILIELVAQTTGICNGMEKIKKHGPDADKKGWIVGIKKAVFHVNEIPIGSRIVTHAENRFKYDSFREVRGQALIDSTIVCEITLQVFQSELTL